MIESQMQIALLVSRNTTTSSSVSSTPKFVSLDFKDSNNDLRVNLSDDLEDTMSELFGDFNKTGGESTKDLRSNGPSDVKIIGPFDGGVVKRPAYSKDMSLEGFDMKNDASDTNKRSRSGSASSQTSIQSTTSEPLTLEEHIFKMQSALSDLDNHQATSGRNRKSKKNGNTSDFESPEVEPTSDSLVVLITQALQSGDDSLLEQCLSCQDSSVILATARSLSSGKVLSLITSLATKFEKAPARGQLVTRF